MTRNNDEKSSTTNVPRLCEAKDYRWARFRARFRTARDNIGQREGGVGSRETRVPRHQYLPYLTSICGMFLSEIGPNRCCFSRKNVTSSLPEGDEVFSIFALCEGHRTCTKFRLQIYREKESSFAATILERRETE